MRMYGFILPLIALMFSSCLETEDPDTCKNVETKQITAVRVISKIRVKEIKAIANQSILCRNDYELLHVKEKNEGFYHTSDIDSITYFQNKDWFVSIGCYIKYDGNEKKEHNVLQIKNDDGINVLDIDSLLIGKTIIFVISELDTAWLFSYKSSLLVNEDPDYNFSASTRMGCHDGYCFVSLPITENEFCFDKNNENMRYLFE